jgi:hypothetical protein
LNKLDEILQWLKEKKLTSQWRQVLLLCNWSRVPWICTYPTRNQTSSQKGQSNCQDRNTKNSQTSLLLHQHDKLLQGPYPTSFRLTHTTYHTYQERCPIQVDGWLSTHLWWTQTPTHKTNGPCLSRLRYSIWNLHRCIEQTNWISNSTEQTTPLAFYSHKLTDSQTRYTVIELELLAIVETLQDYCTILLVTLSRSIRITRTLPLQTSILIMSAAGDWFFEEYGPEIVYLPGVHNIDANFLSRHPISTDSINEIHCIDEIFPINDNDSWRLIPFKPCQNHWGRDLSYHVPHQSQLNTQSSGLPPRSWAS